MSKILRRNSRFSLLGDACDVSECRKHLESETTPRKVGFSNHRQPIAASDFVASLEPSIPPFPSPCLRLLTDCVAMEAGIPHSFISHGASRPRSLEPTLLRQVNQVWISPCGVN